MELLLLSVTLYCGAERNFTDAPLTNAKCTAPPVQRSGIRWAAMQPREIYDAKTEIMQL